MDEVAAASGRLTFAVEVGHGGEVGWMGGRGGADEREGGRRWRGDVVRRTKPFDTVTARPRRYQLCASDPSVFDVPSVHNYRV